MRPRPSKPSACQPGCAARRLARELGDLVGAQVGDAADAPGRWPGSRRRSRRRRSRRCSRPASGRPARSTRSSTPAMLSSSTVAARPRTLAALTPRQTAVSYTSRSTPSMVMSSVGRSRPSVLAASMRSTTSIPSVTRPKTVCLPSSHGASGVVTMKNCEPLVFGPGVGHRQRAADDLVVVELVLELVARAAGAGAGRVAALDHEVLDDPVEDHAVVEALAGELLEVRDGLRRVLVEELERDGAFARAHRGGGGQGGVL